MDSSGLMFMRSRGGYLGGYFQIFGATREINNKMILDWAHKQAF